MCLLHSFLLLLLCLLPMLLPILLLLLVLLLLLPPLLPLLPLKLLLPRLLVVLLLQLFQVLLLLPLLPLLLAFLLLLLCQALCISCNGGSRPSLALGPLAAPHTSGSRSFTCDLVLRLGRLRGLICQLPVRPPGSRCPALALCRLPLPLLLQLVVRFKVAGAAQPLRFRLRVAVPGWAPVGPAAAVQAKPRLALLLLLLLLLCCLLRLLLPLG